MNAIHSSDLHYMQQAIALAHHAETQGEVPVGAIVVLNNQIIGQGWNQPISSCDPTAHAEIIALRDAAKNIGNYRLIDTTMYVTIEPCVMCIGALVHARVKRLVYGARDPKAGAVDSVFQIVAANKLNHKIEVNEGILKEECSSLLSQFFSKKR